MNRKRQRENTHKPRVSDLRVCAHGRHTTEHGNPDLSIEGKPPGEGRAEYYPNVRGEKVGTRSLMPTESRA